MPEYEYEGKFIFRCNVKVEGDTTTQSFVYNTEKEAEIKYHNEVLYGLQLDTLELAYYVVQNEYGVKIANLEKIIDNQEPLDAEIEP